METIIYYVLIIAGVFGVSVGVGFAIGPLLRKNSERYPRVEDSDYDGH